ncbi:SDR family oxidoreductase [Nocardia aurantia]|uniref:3-phenylpropionate-dihydrodiol/cinnamic acid-dihydrodiol dehydrogenase n=1 Tax=Nocardia aurantia TaxID=2585199 RepID=A0A7K0DQB2_9NOCA|nr:SDR family oxidoreductase [Nocardia aurantia]MQY27717.1 3-phenylpropionate-dihydrodiol/cinnamic acid-dihydrodiol dehydrogenase [Nocardia aurantia]
MDTVRDRTAIITGGGSGIGRATARSLARRGANIVVADIDAAAARSAAAAITDAGGRAVAAHCDVAAENAFDELKALALNSFGRVDVMMNNVGVLTRGRPEHLPVAEWQRLIDINLMSVVRSNATFLPLLLEQGHGHIVNTASFAGLYTYSYDRLPYAATKAAVVQISEGLRLYLQPRGIGVTVLCPGPVMTNIMASMPPTFGPEVPTRGPGAQFAPLAPDVVGEQVATAILDDTFMLYTHEAVRDLLVERASDWNAFVAERIRTIEEGENAPGKPGRE